MSRASKLAAARGATHRARHSTNVAREKLQRAMNELAALRAQVTTLTTERQCWLDTDLTAMALVEQEQEIEHLFTVLAKAREALREVERMDVVCAHIASEALSEIDAAIGEKNGATLHGQGFFATNYSAT